MPSPPGDEDEDFILVHHNDVQTSQRAEEVYTQLVKLLKEQYEVKMQDEDWDVTLTKVYLHTCYEEEQRYIIAPLSHTNYIFI